MDRVAVEGVSRTEWIHKCEKVGCPEEIQMGSVRIVFGDGDWDLRVTLCREHANGLAFDLINLLSGDEWR